MPDLDGGVAAFNAGRPAEAARLFAGPARAGDPTAAVFLAHALAAAGRPRAAQAALVRALRRRPRHPALLCALGDLRRAAGRPQAALKAYRRAKTRSAELGAGACLCALGRWEAAAAAFRRAGRSPAARAGLAEALFGAGDAPAAARELGRLERPPARLSAAVARALSLAGDRRPARRLLARADADSPEAARAWGEALLAAGLGRQARALLSRAARRWPGEPAPARLLGEALLQAGEDAWRAWLARAARAGRVPSIDRYAARLLLGRWRAAAEEGRRLVRAARSQEDYDRLLNPLALTLLRRAPRRRTRPRGGGPWPLLFAVSLESLGGDPAAAAAAGERLRRACRWRDEPAEGWMRYLCGHLELQTAGRPAVAEADFRAALAAAPGLWKASAYLGELALCRGRTAEGLARLRATAGRLCGPERADARAWLGAALLWLGRARAAERELAAAAAGGAQFARGWLGAARVLAGRPRQGLADLDAALRGRALEEEALIWRAEAWRALGRPGRARADLEAALRAAPRSDWARLLLARLEADAGGDPGPWLRGVRPSFLNKLGLAGRPGRRELARAFRAARGVRRSAAYMDSLLGKVVD